MSDNLNTFNTFISNFRNDVLDYEYSFDSVGNLFFTDQNVVFNQTFLKISSSNFNYDDNALSNFYDLTFSEFTEQPVSSSIDYSSLVDSLNDQIQSLQDQLATAGVDANIISDLITNASSSKDIIISLRILLGQGTTTDDFSTDFPYLPLNAPSTTSNIVSPSIEPITSSTTITSSVNPNPLSIFDLNGDLMLETNEIKNIQKQYKIGNPVLLNTLGRTDNTKPLTASDLQLIINIFYANVDKINTKETLLSKFNTNGNGMLSAANIKLIKQQYKIGNPIVTSFSTDGKKTLSNIELLSLEKAILSGSAS